MAIQMKLRGFDNIESQLNAEVTKLVNQAQRVSALQAVSELVEVTPVDTGRARSAWSLNKSKVLIDNQEGSLAANPAIILGPIPVDQIETLYITNGTPYIQDLNAGSSEQAPPRFVEKTIAKYFEINGVVSQSIRQ